MVVLVHGGCFKAAYANTRDLAPMADALKDVRIASWNIEYRRLGQPGGGWPGTYIDVGRAVDYLRTLAGRYPLDLGRVVIVGHSAGGHLAMWAAARARLPTSSPLYATDPLPVRGVMDLAGAPATVPERYEQASAIELLPLGIPQVLVVGTHEEFVPLPLVEAYAWAATRAGDSVRVVVIPDAGHFDIASPRSSAWSRVESAIRSLLGGTLPADPASANEKRLR